MNGTGRPLDHPGNSGPGLPARYYRRLAGLLATQGLEPDRLLGDSGVDAQRLLAADGEISLGEANALALSALRLSARDDLGLLLGSALEPASHDVLGLAMQQASCLDTALRLAARYFSLLSPGFRMRYRLQEETAELTIYPSLAFSPDALRLHLDTVLIATLSEVSFLLGQRHVPNSVDLGWERPHYARRYADLIGRPPSFSALPFPGIRLCFSASQVLRPRPEANAPSLAAARQRCEAQVQRTLSRHRLSDWTRMMLHHSAHGIPRKQELAQLLGISTRSFTRYLSREGNTFRQLSDDTRQQAAEVALQHGEESITALAHRLGFSDGANFNRAFRRRHGCAPRSFRR